MSDIAGRELHAQLLRSPALTLALVNDELAADNEQMMFVTLFLAVIDLATGEMSFVNAGHNPPALRRGREVTRLEAPRNMSAAPYVRDRSAPAAGC